MIRRITKKADNLFKLRAPEIYGAFMAFKEYERRLRTKDKGVYGDEYTWMEISKFRYSAAKLPLNGVKME